MSRTVIRIAAVLWLHTLRLWRFRLSFLNLVLSETLWMLIFMLGAMSFVPREEWSFVLPTIFWSIVVWNLVAYSAWFVAGWMNHVIALGLVEEHLVTDVSIPLFLAGRSVVCISVATSIAIALGSALSQYLGIDMLGSIENAALLLLGLALALIMGVSYALILAALGLRWGVPPLALDVTNVLFFVVGISTPLRSLPPELRYVAMLVPYAYPTELVRYGALGIEPLLGLETTLMMSLALTVAMVSISIATFRYCMELVRKYGVKGVGRM